MDVKELRRILRTMHFNVRKRDMRGETSQTDCLYELTMKGEPLFYINPEMYNSVEQVKRKVKHELRDEIVHPLG